MSKADLFEITCDKEGEFTKLTKTLQLNYDSQFHISILHQMLQFNPNERNLLIEIPKKL